VKLALGTVQFGVPYGIANQTGQVSLNSGIDLLQRAWAAGINTLDTAMAYGESEQRLGEIGVDQWRVISKLPAFPEGFSDVRRWVKKSVSDSLAKLKVAKLYGLLLHRPEQLLTSDGEIIYRELLSLKARGKIDKIGVSVYEPAQLDTLFSAFQFDLIQVPFNILDRRFVTSGWFQRCYQLGIEIHVRSIFLQGLLLMQAVKRPAIFNKWQSLWDKWEHWLHSQALTPLQACIGFALSQSEIDRVIVGVDSSEQLQQILNVAKLNTSMNYQSFEIEDLRLLNPSNWSKL
jgi:aryl-alcohol dehydrogenase-like predicted oxidoreductase